MKIENYHEVDYFKSNAIVPRLSLGGVQPVDKANVMHRRIGGRAAQGGGVANLSH